MVMWHCCQTGILVWCFGYEHVTPLLRQCHWLKAAQLDILAYKCLHGLACPAIGKVTVGLALHWPCVTDLVYAPTGSRPKYEHPANTLHGVWYSLTLQTGTHLCHWWAPPDGELLTLVSVDDHPRHHHWLSITRTFTVDDWIFLVAAWDILRHHDISTSSLPAFIASPWLWSAHMVTRQFVRLNHSFTALRCISGALVIVLTSKLLLLVHNELLLGCC